MNEIVVLYPQITDRLYHLVMKKMSKASVNKVILVGSLGHDPEVSITDSGLKVSTISIATNDGTKDKVTGKWIESTEWHRVVLWDKLADVAGQYLKKGSLVYIEGRIQTKKWKKEGIDMYSTQIVANTLQMLGGKNS